MRLKKTDYWAPEIAKNNLQYLINDLRIPAYPYDFSFLTSWNINLYDLTFYGEREGCLKAIEVWGEFPSGTGKS